MLKHDSFRPTVKYAITLRTHKPLQKFLNFFSSSIKERKAMLSTPSGYQISFSSYVDIECSSFKSTKGRKPKFDTDDLIFRKDLIYLL